MFLTYGTYEPLWWISQSNHSDDDECSSDDLANTLQYSLAVSHFNASMTENILHHVCYDAVFSLAYALKRVMQNGGSDTLSLNVGESEHCQCRYTSYISSLIDEQLRNMNFFGKSVSITGISN